MKVENETRHKGRTVALVLGAPIDATDWSGALRSIETWAKTGESRYVCICNVHSVVTASRDPEFAAAISGADLATPDGAPVAWMLRRLGFDGQQRINGPDLMHRYCSESAKRNEPMFLYGSTDPTLAALQVALRHRYPGINIVGALSPPFRPLSEEEDAAIIEKIRLSGARTVWVGLGCPKQELWMAAHRGRVSATMIGVGAAFDYLAGTKRRAPSWMQHAGLEWLFRLGSEPRRTWRRYLVTNTLFIAGALRQIGSGWFQGANRSPTK